MKLEIKKTIIGSFVKYGSETLMVIPEDYENVFLEIVKRFNIHEELIEALEMAHKELQGADCFMSQIEWAKIESALQKAKDKTI